MEFLGQDGDVVGRGILHVNPEQRPPLAEALRDLLRVDLLLDIAVVEVPPDADHDPGG